MQSRDGGRESCAGAEGLPGAPPASGAGPQIWFSPRHKCSASTGVNSASALALHEKKLQ